MTCVNPIPKAYTKSISQKRYLPSFPSRNKAWGLPVKDTWGLSQTPFWGEGALLKYGMLLFPLLWRLCPRPGASRWGGYPTHSWRSR